MTARAGEYIVEFHEESGGAAKREEIVRCRDCKHFRESDATCHSWQWHNWDAAIEVDPDGFCAWGERRKEVRNG